MSENNDYLVRFKGVQKSYDGESLIIKNLNLDITKGEFLTLLGPSGSGKTTCLMMLAGFEPATYGEIFLNESPINNTPPHKRNIGMVFQNYALFPHMTVAENLGFPLKMRKIAKLEIKKRVAKALDMVQLDDFASRLPAQLSGGQQQRVAVARALIFDPKIVLMDEPLGALDKNLREQMQYEIKHIHERLGVTIMYVTHDQGEALTMSDRVAVFDDGEIQQIASPDTLYEYPSNAFVADFIGDNNKILGKIHDIENGQCTVVTDNGTKIFAKAVNIDKVDSTTTLSIRPERVCINPDDSIKNYFSAKVEELIYLGDHIRSRISVCNVSDFIVKIPNSSIHDRLKEGDIINIGWNVKDCHALDYIA